MIRSGIPNVAWGSNLILNIYIYIFFSAVSFSLLSKERVIFEQVFQIERRILRAAFEVQSSSSIAFLLKICICVTLVSG